MSTPDRWQEILEQNSVARTAVEGPSLSWLALIETIEEARTDVERSVAYNPRDLEEVIFETRFRDAKTGIHSDQEIINSQFKLRRNSRRRGPSPLTRVLGIGALMHH